MTDTLWTDEFEQRLYQEAEDRFGQEARQFLEDNADSHHGSYQEPIYAEAEKQGIPVEDLYRQEMIKAVLADLENNYEEYFR